MLTCSWLYPCSWGMLNFLWHLQFIDAIKPVLNGAILSSHPVLSDWLSKSQMCFSLITVIFTSIKWLQSPFTKSQRPVFIVFHLYWTVTESGTTQMKLRIIFQVIINPCFFLKINVFSSIFEGDFVHLVVKYWHCLKSFFFYNTPQSVEAVLSSQPIISSHPVIPHRWQYRFHCNCSYFCVIAESWLFLFVAGILKALEIRLLIF